MTRFLTISFLLHAALFASIAISNRTSFKTTVRTEVFKVNIAPMPQPKVLGTPNAPEETAEKEKPVNKKPEEKSPPAAKPSEPKPAPAAAKKTPAAQPAEKKGLPDGLPDIKPQIYTGSGRGFSYSYYLNILLNKIGNNWHNPFRGQDVILKTVVYFEIDQNGNIYNVRLEDDSGNETYNETTIRAVASAGKLPPLPQEFSNDYLKVHLEFLTAP